MLLNNQVSSIPHPDSDGKKITLTHTPLIVRYLAKNLNNGQLWPQKEEDQLEAEMAAL